MKKVVFRVDASKEIGLGHLTRCLSLANKFRNYGHKIYFLINENKIAINEIKEQKFEFLYNSQFSILNFQFDIFIADVRNELSKENIKKLKEKGVLTVAIDSSNEYSKECDICFYPPHSKIKKEQYKGKIYQGFEYVILRDEFYKKYKKIKNKIPNVLVMMGGTDAHNLTLSVVKQLLSLKQKFNISVVIRKGHKDYDIIKNISPSVKVYSDIKNMAKFLTKINFGIISFGVTAYELLAMQIPAIHICLDEDHWSASEYFEKNCYAKRYKKDDLKFEDINFKWKIIQKRVQKMKIIERFLNEY
jgi:UDP-2,4-diacetamido-2,4,6-trideoxy-beta-L-altropyranose hydrolase